MHKPANYDSNNYTPVNLGGHYAKIMDVEETKSQSGKDMIVVRIDFDGTDTQPQYFAKAYRADTRENKKWPNQATRYILAENRDFNRFIAAIKASNQALEQIDSGAEIDLKKAKNARVGVVYGEDEEWYEGESRIRRRIRYFCDYNKVAEQQVPAFRPAKENAAAAPTVTGNEDFMQVPDDLDGLPFA